MEPTLVNVIELLQDVNEDADYETCTTLVDDRVLTSFDILSIISEIDNTFDVAVPAKDVIPANFNSAAALLEMIERLSEE